MTCTHVYETIKETSSGLRERCKRCGKQVQYNRTPQGTVDEKRYAHEHVRDFLQSREPKMAKAFEREYGKPIKLPENTTQSYEDIVKEAQEELKSMTRTIHGPNPRRIRGRA